MIEEDFNSEVTDMKICQPSEYELSFKMLGPDRLQHQGVFNKEKFRMGYIHNKLHKEDDSWYAPYLVYEMGIKTGIDVSETETGIILHKNVNQDYYRESWFESSIVYDRQPYYKNGIRLSDNVAYVSPEIIESDYFINNPEAAKEKRNSVTCGERKPTIDDYVNSYVWYLTTHGSKPKQEYSKTEIDAIKQELIDRALFSLKFESYGNFDILLRNYKDAALEPYYPSKFGMYFLNVREERVVEHLEENDETFKETLDSNYKPQYASKRTFIKENSSDVIKYIFETYPEQAQKSYKKLSKFTKKDMEELLEKCTRMSDNHKKFALRAFEVREKEFNDIYQECLKHQEPDR